ncbi:MAG TPA: hypothetical protein VMG32_10015 [Anaeromyxobacteraceae bacterium]|nr:hypothetical protein [Anaeromyxobacteraceae bacterium]
MPARELAPSLPAEGPSSAAGPCPAPGPAGLEPDLAIVLWVERRRTEEEVGRARAEVDLTPEGFADVLGEKVLSDRPLTRALVVRAEGRRTPPTGP